MSRQEIELDCAEAKAAKVAAYFARPDAKSAYVFAVSRCSDPEVFAEAVRRRGLRAVVEPSKVIEVDGESFVSFPFVRVSRPPEGGVFIAPRLAKRVATRVANDTLGEKLRLQAHPEPRFRRFLRRARAEIRFVLGMPSFWILLGILGWMALSVFLVERWAK